MYLEGLITVDPSQLTEIVKTKPTKAFGKIASLLTAGMASPKEEVETFCALSILQQLYKVVRSVGINDVVRIAKDETVFYHDTEGRTDDLKVAMEAFAIRSVV